MSQLSHCESGREVTESRCVHDLVFHLLHFSVVICYLKEKTRKQLFQSLRLCLPSSPALSPVTHPVANNVIRAKVRRRPLIRYLYGRVIIQENKTKPPHPISHIMFHISTTFWKSDINTQSVKSGGHRRWAPMSSTISSIVSKVLRDHTVP